MTSILGVLWAAPAALGFALLFNVRLRALPIVAAIAVLAKFISVFGQHVGLTIIAADFIAAFAVGAIAYTIGPRLGEASPVFAFAPVIPLVPGAVIAKAFITSFTTWITSSGVEAQQNSADFLLAASSGLSAAAIMLALCLGAISPMLLLPRARTAED
ncbi:MAG: hypothetical protein QG671_3719 [Actinomycetota bacterium]|nr:hypothetical protein [Actinomycetota bacterium]HQZ85897.1 threonine/serine exporter family protein [Actinomycetota bacterium]